MHHLLHSPSVFIFEEPFDCLAVPSSNIVSGSQPTSALILSGAIAYLRSCTSVCYISDQVLTYQFFLGHFPAASLKCIQDNVDNLNILFSL